MNNIQVEFFPVGNDGIDIVGNPASARSLRTNRADSWLSDYALLNGWLFGYAKNAIPSVNLEGNLPLTLRINFAEDVFTDYVRQPDLNSWQPQYSLNSPLLGTSTVTSPKYNSTKLTILEMATNETTEQKVIRVSSNTGAVGDRMPWGLDLSFGAGIIPEKVINATTPLESNALLGGSFGGGNDYARRLKLQGQLYIPPVPSAKPSK